MKTAELTTYSVTTEGVIVVPGMPEPKIRADVFEQVDLRGVHTRHELIALIKACQPLTQHFRQLSQAYLDRYGQAGAFVDSLLAKQRPRAGAQQLILRALRRDPDEGWRQWIDYSGDAALEGFLQHVRDWLDHEIVWSESDEFDTVWNGQAAALIVFEDLPKAILKALGVKIVDGDVPGSSYSAAELVRDIDEANRVAAMLELDFRFEATPADHSEVRHG